MSYAESFPWLRDRAARLMDGLAPLWQSAPHHVRVEMTVEQIAAATGVSRRSIQRALPELQDAGFIAYVGIKGRGTVIMKVAVTPTAPGMGA